MKGGTWRPPFLPSSPLVTVLLSLKNEEGLYASRVQYLKSCLDPVPFPKYVIYKTQAEVIQQLLKSAFMRDKKSPSIYWFICIFPVSGGKKKKKKIRWPFFLLMELWCQPGLHDTLGHKVSWELSVFPQTLNLIWNSNNSHSINDLQPLINCRLLW